MFDWNLRATLLGVVNRQTLYAAVKRRRVARRKLPKAKHSFLASKSAIKLGARAYSSSRSPPLIFNFRRTIVTLSRSFFFLLPQLPAFNSVKVSRRDFASRAIKEQSFSGREEDGSECIEQSRSLTTMIRHLTSQLDEFTFLIDRLSLLSLPPLSSPSSSLPLSTSSLLRQSAAQTNSDE